MDNLISLQKKKKEKQKLIADTKEKIRDNYKLRNELTKKYNNSKKLEPKYKLSKQIEDIQQDLNYRLDTLVKTRLDIETLNDKIIKENQAEDIISKLKTKSKKLKEVSLYDAKQECIRLEDKSKSKKTRIEICIKFLSTHCIKGKPNYTAILLSNYLSKEKYNGK